MSQIHKCGKCKGEFDNEEAYINHTCEATGKTPADIEHLGPEFALIAEAAQKRGAERKANE